MVVGAILGIVTGVTVGLATSLLIATIAGLFERNYGMMGGGTGMPYSMASFLGMGFGAVVGAILGGTAANK